MRVFLIGYMGCGKSTLGRNLAEALGYSWIDIDDAFEIKYKISISDFFIRYGETYFRELEHKLLMETVSTNDVVVSTGGGAPCYHNNMELMNQHGITLYLSATPQLLLSRIQLSPNKRPLFRKMEGNDALQKIASHLETRISFYEKASLKVDAENPDIEEIKQLILTHSFA